MPQDTLKRQKIIEKYENKDLESIKKRRKIMLRVIGILLVIILILIFFLSSRIGNPGDKYVSAWEIKKIELTDNDLQITKDTELNIFSRKNLKGEKVFAPSEKGTYKFAVKNDSHSDMIYDIKFLDSMTDYIDIKYRLKMDNVYIRGNENEYVSIDKLGVKDIVVPKKSTNVYTLEWYWDDGGKEDNSFGIQEKESYYYFRLEINSNIYDKRSE